MSTTKTDKQERLKEINDRFEYINKPDENEKIKHNNLIKLHSLLNEYISETKQPVDENFFEYKSNLNSIKNNINLLKMQLRK
ncbi:hypothetical protein F0358_10550 [Empedobacter brevis]|uniref:hypothetical protein n=1 Tax=Empedobacter brevis TaxID=247 RepID=UPI00123C90E2|nr:hypothetical protein [Empedobacter brevis]QES93114.1 hypothetical protein F0358_10550 [Empedobacter brevis]